MLPKAKKRLKERKKMNNEKEKDIKKELSRKQFQIKSAELATMIKNCAEILIDTYNVKITTENLGDVMALLIAVIISVVFDEKEVNFNFLVKLGDVVHSIFIKEGNE